MVKTYILDTNVLLHDPKSLFSFQDNELIVPLVILEELDRKKDGPDEIARNAREVIRSLDDLRSSGNLSQGIATKDGGLIRVELNHKDQVPVDLDPGRADNRIIGVALGLNKNGKNVILVTKDINLRVKCDALGIIAEDYNSDRIADDVDEIYTGSCDLTVEESIIDELNANGNVVVPGTFFENQYVYLKVDGQKKSALARFANGQLIALEYHKDVWGVNPRNREQTYALDALFNPTISLVTLIGKAGSGKTLLSVVAGISQVFDKHTYKKLVIAKPTISLGKQHDLGFLPGDLQTKLDPWLSSIWDNMSFLFGDKGKTMIENYIDSGQIELCALQYIRGRSIRDSLIIIDESQNLSKHEVKSITTRAGENSKIVLTGDINQIDSMYVDGLNNGLSNLVEAFKEYNLAAHLTFKRGERSELATLASLIL